MPDSELLVEYSKEIYGTRYRESEILTVEQLVDSHRNLREWNIRHNNMSKEERQKIWDAAKIKAEQEAVEYNWISHEKLRSMTIQEIINLLGED